MKLQQFFAFLLSLMLFALPCLALAEASAEDTLAVIGGADGPTAIITGELEETPEAKENEEETIEETKEPQPLTLGESLIFMVKGLVGIFLVTAMIILVLRILEKATHKKETPEE